MEDLLRHIADDDVHRAHAAASPGEGKNAVDAAVLAYTSIAVLRQQLKPTHRVHGMFEGKDWAPNSEYTTLTSNFCIERHADLIAYSHSRLC